MPPWRIQNHGCDVVEFRCKKIHEKKKKMMMIVPTQRQLPWQSQSPLHHILYQPYGATIPYKNHLVNYHDSTMSATPPRTPKRSPRKEESAAAATPPAAISPARTPNPVVYQGKPRTKVLPDGAPWPDGWSEIVTRRQSGASAGKEDTLWYPPGAEAPSKALRSLPAVLRHLGRRPNVKETPKPTTQQAPAHTTTATTTSEKITVEPPKRKRGRLRKAQQILVKKKTTARPRERPLPKGLLVYEGPPRGELAPETPWPPGWTERRVQRQGGIKPGAVDRYFVPPGGRTQLRSKIQVLRYLEEQGPHVARAITRGEDDEELAVREESVAEEAKVVDDDDNNVFMEEDAAEPPKRQPGRRKKASNATLSTSMTRKRGRTKTESNATPSAAPPRKRGRPKKTPEAPASPPEAPTATPQTPASPPEAPATPSTKKRGRPEKTPKTPQPTTPEAPATPSTKKQSRPRKTPETPQATTPEAPATPSTKKQGRRKKTPETSSEW